MADDWARPVVHWEIEAKDPERQRAFYADLFNWKIGDGLHHGDPARHRRPRARPGRAHPPERAIGRDALRAGGRPARLAGQVGGARAPPSWPSRSTFPAARRWPASPIPRAIPSCWCRPDRCSVVSSRVTTFRLAEGVDDESFLALGPAGADRAGPEPARIPAADDGAPRRGLARRHALGERGRRRRLRPGRPRTTRCRRSSRGTSRRARCTRRRYDTLD